MSAYYVILAKENAPAWEDRKYITIEVPVANDAADAVKIAEKLLPESADGYELSVKSITALVEFGDDE